MSLRTSWCTLSCDIIYVVGKRVGMYLSQMDAHAKRLHLHPTTPTPTHAHAPPQPRTPTPPHQSPNPGPHHQNMGVTSTMHICGRKGIANTPATHSGETNAHPKHVSQKV
jgi:hypothetical protein